MNLSLDDSLQLTVAAYGQAVRLVVGEGLWSVVVF
jgi:hypothetical protein